MALIANVVQGSASQRLALLIHGYGADERDLGGLLTYLDPDGELATVLPRGPYAVPGTPGYSWYSFGGQETASPESGGTYATALAELDDFLDEQSAALGFDRAESIVGGFSQGAGLALGLALQRSDRPRPKAALAMSPAIDTAAFDLDERDAPPVLVQHGTNDPMIPVQRSRDLARQLRALGVPTVYREYPMAHQVALESLRDATDWLGLVVAGERPDETVPDDPIELVPSVTTAQWEAEVLKSELPVIVDFWAPWCGPCKQVSPIVETIAAMRKGFYKVVKVNIDDEPQLAQEYGVQSIPMIGLVRNGRLERTSVGAKARPQLEAELGMLVIP
jgi:thioredoxin 1